MVHTRGSSQSSLGHLCLHTCTALRSWTALWENICLFHSTSPHWLASSLVLFLCRFPPTLSRGLLKKSEEALPAFLCTWTRLCSSPSRTSSLVKWQGYLDEAKAGDKLTSISLLSWAARAKSRQVPSKSCNETYDVLALDIIYKIEIKDVLISQEHHEDLTVIHNRLLQLCRAQSRLWINVGYYDCSY